MDSTPPSRTWFALATGVVAAGGVGWLVDVALLWVFVTFAGVPVGPAAVVAFVLSGAVNFLLNRIVFGASDRGRVAGQAGRYLVVFALNTVAVGLLVPLLVDLVSVTLVPEGLHLVAGKALATALMLPLNMVAYRYWVFRPSPAMSANSPSGGGSPTIDA